MHVKFFLLSIVGLAILWSITGCNSDQPETSGAITSDKIKDSASHENSTHGKHDESNHSHSSHNHSNHDHTEHKSSGNKKKSDMEKMKESLSSLSSDDRDSAMKQHFCPVTGDMLGTMGKPVKIEVQGKNVWICCNGCKDELLENPEKYLAKIKSK